MLSDEGLNPILSSLSRLVVLDVEGCDLVTKKLLSNIPGKCKYLKKLVLSGCSIDNDDVRLAFESQRRTLRVSFNPLYMPVIKSSR